jgi:RNA-directed DNA polymerase
MKVQYGKEVAIHSGPESCGGAREGVAEALTGETGGSAIEPRNHNFGTPTLLCSVEGNTDRGVKRESRDGPARSETLHTPGSLLHRSWDSVAPGAEALGNSGKAKCHKPEVSAAEKSDTPIVPGKPSNKGTSPAETVEGRGVAKGNVGQTSASRTQSRISCATTGLERVRKTARQNRRLEFRALMHHITPQLLEGSFTACNETLRQVWTE